MKYTLFTRTMNKRFYFTTNDKQELLAKYNLKCNFELGSTTYITQITNDDSIQILLLVVKKNGSILQKWSLVYGVCVSSSINEPSEATVDCDSGDFKTYTDISNDNNLKCFLCEKNK